MTPARYCTYFNAAYASRGRVMVESLRANGDENPLVILALDDATYEEVSTWTHLHVRTRHVKELELRFPQLAFARTSRSTMEYIFTLTPWLTKWVLEEAEPGTWVTYLDADLAFFAGTQEIYASLTSASIAIVEHRFSWEQTWRSKYGTYNVSWVGFRQDQRGLSCLNWWADQCLSWCLERAVDGRFADQGYLDRFPIDFTGVKPIDLPGANVAPWNLRRHRISGSRASGVTVDGEPLIFFHFHGLRQSGSRFYFKHLPYLARTTQEVRELIYRPYCRAISRVASEMGSTASAPLARHPNLLLPLRTSRAAVLQWLGEWRGDYLDL